MQQARLATRSVNEHVVDNHGPNPRGELIKDNDNREAADFGSNEAEREGIPEEEGRISDAIKYVIRDIPTKPRFNKQGDQKKHRPNHCLRKDKGQRTKMEATAAEIAFLLGRRVVRGGFWSTVFCSRKSTSAPEFHPPARMHG